MIAHRLPSIAAADHGDRRDEKDLDLALSAIGRRRGVLSCLGERNTAPPPASSWQLSIARARMASCRAERSPLV